MLIKCFRSTKVKSIIKGDKMSKLVEYLNALDADAKLKNAHDLNQKQTMREFGLSEEEIDVVLSGDQDLLMKFLGEEKYKLAIIQSVHHGPKISSPK